MRKLLYIFFLLLSVQGFGQTFRFGSPNASAHLQGSVVVDSSIILPDTLRSAGVGAFGKKGSTVFIKTVSGWKPVADSATKSTVDSLVSKSINIDESNLHPDYVLTITDSATRQYGLRPPGGGSTYSAGWGLNLTGTTFKVDSGLVASFARLGKVRDSILNVIAASNYVKAIDTASMLVNYLRTGAKLQVDTSTGLVVYAGTGPVIDTLLAKAAGPGNWGMVTPTLYGHWETAFGWGNHAGLYAPVGRTLTINGTTFDLSANRSWTVSTGSSFTPSVGVKLNPKNELSTVATQHLVAGGRSAIVDRKDKYLGFPWPFVVHDTAFCVLKYAPDHGSDGPFTLYRSINGMSTWDSIKVINGLSVSVWTAGVTRGDTIIISYQKNSDLKKIYWMYSADRGQTFITSDSTVVGSGHIVSPFGTPKQLPSGRILQPYYELDSTTSTNRWMEKIMSSTDGVHWSHYSDVTNYTPNLFLGSINFSWTEADFEVIPGSTSDATTKLVIVMAEENYGGQQQWYSLDGGATWQPPNTTNWGILSGFYPQGIRSPVFVKYFKGKLYLIGGIRTISGADGNNFKVLVAEGDPAVVLTDETKWSKPRTIYRGNTDITGVGADFGYTVPFEFDNQLMYAGYDMSVLYSPTSGEGKRIRTFFNSTEPAGFVQTHNINAQSIPTATETLVLTPYIYVDDENMFNTDSGFVIVQRDGYYSLQAHFTFTPNGTGSYRQGYIKIINPGRNDTVGNVLLSKVTIPGHASNLDFNRIELKGMTFLRAGEKVKVFARHDASGSLNLLNTMEERIDLTIKRIN